MTAYALFGTSTSTGLPSGNTLTDGGFQLYWTGAKAGLDMPNPTVNVTAGTFTGTAYVVNKGGSSTNAGTTRRRTNHAPSVTAPAQKTIPIRTPFTLTGSGTDVDNDTLTYLWEQNDRGAANGAR